MIFQLVYFGHFGYNDILNMPTIVRDQMYELLKEAKKEEKDAIERQNKGN